MRCICTYKKNVVSLRTNLQKYSIMKKLGILLLACITALNLWAEEFKIGKFTFETITSTTIELVDVDQDITNVFLSETINYDGKNYTITSIGVDAFKDCSSLTSVTIPNSVTSIESGAFEGCSSLRSVTIPSSVTRIGDSAFYGCSSLTSVTIPNSVTNIGNGAFAGTALYKNPANWENGALYINDCLIKVDGGYVGNYRIEENTRLIAGFAFGGCSSLTSVTIPSSVTSIGSYAFKGCTALTSVTIPSSVTSIGSYAFWGCSSLISVTIPKSVTSIGHDAFKGTALYNNPANWENGALYINDCLIKVDGGYVGNYRIEENTRLIAGFAFGDCSALTSVTIPNSVKNIEGGAFYGCSSLISVTIPNSVTSIGWFTFDGCSSLRSVTIPNSVTSIGWGAFWGCSALTSVTIPSSVTSIEDDVFPEHTQIIRR